MISFRRRPFFGSIVSLFSVIVALFAVLPRASAIIDASLQMQLGNPTGATTSTTNHNHYLIQRTAEAMDFSDNLGQPNWASWDLTTDDVGSSGRGSFKADSSLPSGFTIVGPDDYPGSGSGYDRGHMCPSGDRTISDDVNDQVFLMSNMIPQTSDNNQGPWASFENYCRTVASAGNEILITCGPSLFDGTKIPTGHVWIPQSTWKFVVVVPTGSGTALSRISVTNRVIAIKMPNISGIRSVAWQTYITNVSTIQADTGFTFFSAVPSNIAKVWRGIIDGTAAPSISNFSPGSGTAGTSVVITGANLTGALDVAFNGTAASYTVNSSTQITATVPAGATTGPITVTTPGGQATSAGSFSASVSSAVVINTQPVSMTNNAGSTVNFSVQASGAATLAYQWRLTGTNLSNGGNISGATSSVLTLSNITQTNVGSYSVVITNSSSAATSTVATLTVLATNANIAPTISTQPQDVTVNAGQDAVFQTIAAGTAPLSYAWRFNGTAISGATLSSYTVPAAQAANAGSYSVLVTNVAGTVLSSNALLTVVSVTVSNGILAQWDFDQTNTASLTAPAPVSGAGTTSLIGGTTSTWASGTGSTDTAAVNNGAWSTVTYPASTVGNKTAGAQFNVGTFGYKNIIITWSQRNSGSASKYFRLQYTTNGTAFIDANVATLTGTSFQSFSNNLTGLAGVDNNANFAFRIVSEFEQTATGSGNSSYVPVSSTYGAGGTARFDMVTVAGSAQVAATPPTITAQPQNQSAVVSSNVTFSVGVTGTAPFNYTWQRSGTNIAATNSTLTLTNVQAASAGTYRVVVSNSAGFATSSNAVLTVYTTAAANLSGAVVTPGSVQFSINGVPGYSYIIQATDSLSSPWVSVQTNTAPFVFTETNTLSHAARYFRVVSNP